VNAQLDHIPIVYENEADLLATRSGPVAAAICVGTANSTRVRRRLYHQLVHLGYTLPSLIDPSTVREHAVSIGDGVHVLSGSSLSAGSSLGNNVLINHGVIVEHDCRIDDHCHVACGSILCGGVRVGEGTLVGAGSVILPGVTIGRNCVIGAGSTVTRNVPDEQIYAGNPARPLLQSRAA
jgi:UDP-perosamine 4-acetyltransferase